MKKPIIVLSPQKMPMEAPFGGDYHYTNTFNTAAVLKAGGLPVLPPFLTEAEARSLMETADGLFLTGGADIDPALYGQDKDPACGELQPERDASDLALLRAALALQKPVLCICRGFQLGNAFLGGTLYQDIGTQFETAVQHRASDRYAQAVHSVRLEPEAPLARLLGKTRLEVNSLHHQAVRNLAPTLKAMAYAPDGLVESWYLDSRTQWLRGYQWHPEMEAPNPDSDAIFREFMTACGREEEK